MKKYDSKQDLWSLFLMCAFPLHLWTLLLAFRDLSWLAERTNFGDAIGVLSYGMIFALFESLLLFTFAFLLELLLPLGWGREKRLAIIGALILILAFWAMLPQLSALQVWNIQIVLAPMLAGFAHPLRVAYFFAFIFTLPSVILPILALSKSQKTLAVVLDLIGRISLLTMFYLFLDVAALIVVVARNL